VSDRGSRGAHLGERGGDAVDVVDVLVAERVWHAGFGEQPPAPGLRPERQQPRFGAEQGRGITPGSRPR
jgi:hypothetical protein